MEVDLLHVSLSLRDGGGGGGRRMENHTVNEFKPKKLCQTKLCP